MPAQAALQSHNSSGSIPQGANPGISRPSTVQPNFSLYIPSPLPNRSSTTRLLPQASPARLHIQPQSNKIYHYELVPSKDTVLAPYPPPENTAAGLPQPNHPPAFHPHHNRACPRPMACLATALI